MSNNAEAFDRAVAAVGHENVSLGIHGEAHGPIQARLAGLRIGFALGDPGLIGSLDVVKDSYNVDRLAIVAAVAAIQDGDHHRKIVDHVVTERAWLAEQIRELRFDVAPSAANFLFVQPPFGNSAAAVADALRERRILIRHYDREPIAGWFRITIGTRDQHERLLDALKEVLA